jgi:Flp pilus assembly CpaE family ATPase
MPNYFTDQDAETKELIEQCIEGLDYSVRADYLINCISMSCVKDKTVKEIFEAELLAKIQFEDNLTA